MELVWRGDKDEARRNVWAAKTQVLLEAQQTVIQDGHYTNIMIALQATERKIESCFDRLLFHISRTNSYHEINWLPQLVARIADVTGRLNLSVYNAIALRRKARAMVLSWDENVRAVLLRYIPPHMAKLVAHLMGGFADQAIVLDSYKEPGDPKFTRGRREFQYRDHISQLGIEWPPFNYRDLYNTARDLHLERPSLLLAYPGVYD